MNFKGRWLILLSGIKKTGPCLREPVFLMIIIFAIELDFALQGLY